jgi:hypothetical protein
MGHSRMIEQILVDMRWNPVAGRRGLLAMDESTVPPILNIWHGQDANVPEAQRAALYRANYNRAAGVGEYGTAMEPT